MSGMSAIRLIPIRILTGRKGGLQQFVPGADCQDFQIAKSDADAFSTGHASTSISCTLGISAANAISGKNGYVVAVISDGALTGGLAYEGLNNAGRLNNRNLIVILNDNEMSISRNVGSIARYLAHIERRPDICVQREALKISSTASPKIGEADPSWDKAY